MTDFGSFRCSLSHCATKLTYLSFADVAAMGVTFTRSALAFRSLDGDPSFSDAIYFRIEFWSGGVPSTSDLPFTGVLALVAFSLPFPLVLGVVFASLLAFPLLFPLALGVELATLPAAFRGCLRFSVATTSSVAWTGRLRWPASTCFPLLGTEALVTTCTAFDSVSVSK